MLEGIVVKWDIVDEEQGTEDTNGLKVEEEKTDPKRMDDVIKEEL